MSDKENDKKWFETWFDSPFYHKLYKERDLKEAEFFIERLVAFLEIEKGTKVLDLACGKGRHALFLSKLGLDVLGLDLAPNSIQEAQVFNSSTLRFDVHDMREIYKDEKFELIFNLFTSFGYFDKESDNLKMLHSIHSMLPIGGRLVIDFMNAEKVIANLVRDEIKIVDQTHFKIKRNYDGNHITKNISFEDKGNSFNFTEKVQALKNEDFDKLLNISGFKICQKFGDFDLSEFQANSSNRLIIVAEKI